MLFGLTFVTSTAQIHGYIDLPTMIVVIATGAVLHMVAHLLEL